MREAVGTVTDTPTRRGTGEPELDRQVVALLDATGAVDDRDQLFEIFATVVRLAHDHPDRLDLKITNAALKEMRQAFNIFAPYRHIPKVTMFGSARTAPADPLYAQARALAESLAAAGWMVITGAGPGIMAAGMEGAGRDMSFGVNIRLPFEQTASQFIAGDPKLVEMKYFFTRKLMLMKESDGFVVLPGGFGTLDEAFELLTLLQTGKAQPAPLVLLEVPGGTYWRAFESFLMEEVIARGYVGSEDRHLFLITDDVNQACDEILGFYRNYHSMRYVGSRLVIRLKSEPTDTELAELNERFGDVCITGSIERTAATASEETDADNVDLPRIAFRFDRVRLARLRLLINAVNELPSAPSEPAVASRG
jgi:uncharacterized protein (TIGR00730 family)